MALLAVNNLSVGYGSQVVAEKLNFAVNAGDYLCIVGENGSGKSTLMKTLLRLQKPVKGEITEGDGLKENEIGYLPQHTVVQKDFPASVREIVLSGCQGRAGFRPFYSSADKKTAAENMERMGITDIADKCYRELSGGQQQRVLLARALCATRKLLLLDEPVSGLDPKVTAEMYSLIAQLNKEGVTIIMISHDIGAAVRYADHILHIGSTVFYGTKEEYLNSKAGRLFMMMQSGSFEDDIKAGALTIKAGTVPGVKQTGDETAEKEQSAEPENKAEEGKENV
jgi:zinc transport system ATP-binding protein